MSEKKIILLPEIKEMEWNEEQTKKLLLNMSIHCEVFERIKNFLGKFLNLSFEKTNKVYCFTRSMKAGCKKWILLFARDCNGPEC